ncbi:MAG: class I tRNA ligase family protein, partial [Eubacterium sp.]|nr:class I tRNA ligase family protein [Eubacterium sp.]
SLQEEEESIMISSWPKFREDYNFKDEENEVEVIKNAVRNIRNMRADMNVPPSKKAKVYVVSGKKEILEIFDRSRVFFATLGYASEVILQADKAGIPEDAVSTVIPDAVIYIPFAELVDLDKEITRLEKEAKRLDGEIKRADGMLHNERFISKAPAAKVEAEREKLAKYTAMAEQVNARLAQLKG